MPTLIFATTYVDCKERAKLTEQWIELHSALNPDCDLLLVDSKSPWPIKQDGFTWYTPGTRLSKGFYSFPDNIGHLSRHGRDGWGRAFCFGLQAAIESGYDHVVHIEGDSLFRLPVTPIIEQAKPFECLSVPVKGTVRDMYQWVETGLMFFRVQHLVETNFIKKYDWPKRTAHPTPEVIIHNILGKDLRMMPWKAQRGDKNQITHQNVLQLDLDWVTHCHKDVWVYDRFTEAALANIK